MDTPPQQYCDNCHSALHGGFCHKCGQEKKSYIRNISGVVTEFFGEFSNWDTRVWQTLVPLWFRPGYLSRRYVAGHRVPYVPPLRLYLLTSIVAFLLFSQFMPADVVLASRDRDQQQRQLDIPGPEPIKTPTDGLTEIDNAAQEDAKAEADISFISAEAEQAFEAQLQKAIIDNPKLAINKFFSLAPQMMFILLPIFALLLKVLYIRSNRYYTEHLIVALHSHSFILQMLIVYLGLALLRRNIEWDWLGTAAAWLEALLLCWIPLYLLLSQKFYYQQSWGKTLLKFWITGLIYGVLSIGSALGLIVLSILWA